MLALCVSNVVNALRMRHLCLPPNTATPLPFNLFLTPKVAAHLCSHYKLNLALQDEGAWRIGRGQSKLAKIDRSKLWDKPMHGRASAFVKREFSSKIPTKARLIQGNLNECTAYEFPEEYMALSMALKETIEFDIYGCKCQFHYAGGMDHNQLSDLITEWELKRGKFGYYDERDGKNWDATMQEPLLRAEADVYMMLGMRAAGAFLERSAMVKGSIRLKNGLTTQTVKYTTSWKRLSGDWNTSVGNTMVSMMIVAATLSELPAELRPSSVDALFMGDDYLGMYKFEQFVCPKALKIALDALDSKWGITPERGIFQDVFATTFISLGVWPRHNGGLQFVPQPAKQLRKLFWTIHKQHGNRCAEQACANAIAFWPVYWGFPLMMKFLSLHYDKTIIPRLSVGTYFEKMITHRQRDVNWAYGFLCRYRLPFTATMFEYSVVDVKHIYYHPVVEEMLRVEALDPQERPQCLS